MSRRRLSPNRPRAETAKERAAAAAGEEKGFRPGVVSAVQAFGDRANFHPHVHALVTRGGWDASGGWVPVPYVDEGSAEELFRHKVLAVLRRRGLLSLEAYSNRARGQRRKAEEKLEASGSSVSSREPVPTPPERAALRRRWANLIPRVRFITEHSVIKRILDHIRKRDRASRAPPRVRSPVARAPPPPNTLRRPLDPHSGPSQPPCPSPTGPGPGRGRRKLL